MYLVERRGGRRRRVHCRKREGLERSPRESGRLLSRGGRENTSRKLPYSLYAVYIFFIFAQTQRERQ